MNTKQMNQFGKKLCDDIILYYLKDFCRRNESDNWIISLCQISMRNFVLSRPGWVKSNKSDDVLVFKDKYPITVNIIYSGSAGMLMINTAIEIAKAELIGHFSESEKNDTEGTVMKIVKCMESQNWMIPFVRNKMAYSKS